jgi:hypothetical protein
LVLVSAWMGDHLRIPHASGSISYDLTWIVRHLGSLRATVMFTPSDQSQFITVSYTTDQLLTLKTQLASSFEVLVMFATSTCCDTEKTVQ